MEQQKRYRYLRRLGIILFFAIWIYIRFSWFDEHFTHYDDIKVDQFTNYKIDLFEMEFGSLADRNSPYKELYHLIYMIAAKPYNWISYAINFSRYWHYAPGQFILTFALLPLASSYESTKFFGRFPSLLSGIAALFLCWKLIKKITGKDSVALSATAVAGFSWQCIIYCMNMGNYEIIICMGFAAALFVLSALEKDTWKAWLVCAVWIGIMSWFQYQAVCLFGGAAFVVLLKGLLSKEKKKKTAGCLAVMCIGYLLVVLPLLSFAYLEGDPTWNMGVHGEYLYQMSLDIGYTLRFFVVNSLKVFKAMLLPVALDRPYANVMAGSYLLLFLTGIAAGISGYRSPDEKKKCRFYITLFWIGVIAAEYFFVFIGKFTLSPTRHSNVMIPAYVTEMAFGIQWLAQRCNRQYIQKLAPVAVTGIIGILWLINETGIRQQRTDLFTEEKIQGILSEFHPDLVIDCSAPQLWYLLGDEYTRREIIDYQTDFYDLDDDSGNNQTILIMSYVAEISQETIRYCREALENKNYLSGEALQKLMEAEPVYFESQWGNADVDFYNVTAGASNGIFYAVYRLE